MELDDYLRALRRSWWAPVLGALAAAVAALVLLPSPPQRSEARIVVGAAEDLVGEGARFSAVESIDAELLNTLADLYTAADTRAGADTGGEDYEVRAIVGPESHAVTVSAEGPDGDTARAVLTEVVDSGSASFVELYDIYRLEVIDPPSAASSSGSPRSTEVLIAALGGAVLGALVAVGREWWTTRRQAGSGLTTA